MSYVMDVLERMLASPSLVPAFVHPVTKKMYIGRRGETHNDIIDRHSNEIDSSHKDNPDPYDRGFYNTRDKTFVNKADSGLDSADLMTKVQRMRKLGVESVDLIDDKEIRPALKHKVTGEVLYGSRKDSHRDVADHHNLDRSKYYQTHDKGWYKPRTKSFYNYGDYDLDSPALMTKVQRFMKYGTESYT